MPDRYRQEPEDLGGRNEADLRKKRIIIIAGILILVAVAAAAVSALVIKRGREEKAALPPESYFAKSEELPSVTDILGERSFEKLGLGEAAKVGKEGASEQEETETVQEDSTAEDELTEKYRYYPEEDAKEEARQYRDYLMNERNFLDVTGDAQEETEEEGAGCRLAGPSREDGWYLEITIETEGSSYTITAVKKKEAWNSYVSRLWEEEKTKETAEETQEPKSSREIAEETVRSMTQTQLKLPDPVGSYEFISNPGLINVDGKEYYRVSAYKKLENGTLTYACAYLMNYASGSVDYKYDDVTEKTEPLG